MRVQALHIFLRPTFFYHLSVKALSRAFIKRVDHQLVWLGYVH